MNLRRCRRGGVIPLLHLVRTNGMTAAAAMTRRGRYAGEAERARRKLCQGCGLISTRTRWLCFFSSPSLLRSLSLSLYIYIFSLSLFYPVFIINSSSLPPLTPPSPRLIPVSRTPLRHGYYYYCNKFSSFFFFFFNSAETRIKKIHKNTATGRR